MKTILVSRYLCDKGHEHKLEQAARRCEKRRRHFRVSRKDVDHRQVIAAERILRGERAAAVARDLGLTVCRSTRMLWPILEDMPGFRFQRYIELLRQPGLGRVRAARKCYQELTNEAQSKRMRECPD